MSGNRFHFIKAEWPDLFEIVIEIEQNLHTSPNISIIKLRQLIEFTLKYIMEYENVPYSKEYAELKTTLELLARDNYIPTNFVALVNNIRKIGNKAVHDNYSDPLQAFELYDKIFEFFAWFVCTYGEQNYKNYVVGLPIYDKVVFQDYLLEIKLGNKELKKKKIDIRKKPQQSGNAFESVKKAAEMGDAEAQYKLGNTYLDYYAEIEDEGLFEDAINMYKAAAKKRHISALLKLIYFAWESDYDGEVDVELDFDIDLKWIRDLSIHGNAEAQYLLGQMYYYGIEVDEDKALALKWIKVSAGNGHVSANQDLVYLYYEGDIDQIDFEVAISSFMEDAEKGDCLAQEMLGELYSDEDSGSPNLEEANKWFQKAAKQGSSIAQEWIERNKLSIASIEELEAMAEDNNAEAMFLLGNKYQFGQGVKVDMSAASEWYQDAALTGYSGKEGDQGLGYFYYSTAQLYHLGPEAIRNKHRAKAFYRLAIEHGYEQANEKIQSLF